MESQPVFDSPLKFVPCRVGSRSPTYIRSHHSHSRRHGEPFRVWPALADESFLKAANEGCGWPKGGGLCVFYIYKYVVFVS